MNGIYLYTEDTVTVKGWPRIHLTGDKQLDGRGEQREKENPKIIQT